MSSNQQPRPFFRLGSFRPMQTTPQAPPPAPAPQPSIVRPGVPRFRTTTQTTTAQETAPATPPRQIEPPAAPTAPAPPPTAETRPTVAQPQAALTNPALDSFPTPSPTQAAPTPSLAIPRFRISAPPQEIAPAAPPRQIGPPTALAAPVPPPTNGTRSAVSQPQAPLTTSALNSSPAGSPRPAVSTPSPSLPSSVAAVPPTVAAAPPAVAAPLLRAPLIQPNLANSKPGSPRPRFVVSSIPSSPTTKTETGMRLSPQQAAVAAALSRAPPTQPNLETSKPVSPQPRFAASSTPSSPTTKTETMMRSSPHRAAAAPQSVSSPRLPTDKSPIRTFLPQSPAAPQPQTMTSVLSGSARESSALEHPLINKPHPETSTTPTITSPMRKVSLPSPESKTKLGSRSPPPSEPLPTAVPTSIVSDRGHAQPLSPPRNGKMISKTPPQSPLTRPLSRPPSPLTLPPAQIKTTINHEPNTVPKDQTSVMTHERNGKPMVMPRVNDTYEFVETTYKYIGQDGEGKDVHKKNDEAGQSGMNVIRLAGENHGAIMELGPSRMKENSNGRKTGAGYGKGSVEESSNEKNNKSVAIQAPPLTAFMNSNVQGMNNSIVFNTSCSHNDPGVHLFFSRKPNGGYVSDHVME